MNKFSRAFPIAFVALLSIASIAQSNPGTKSTHPFISKGPNGGFLETAGSFAIEIVVDDAAMRVFLFDNAYSAATTEKSSVAIRLRRNEIYTKVSCKKDGDHYTCDKPALDKPGSLFIQATRAGRKGAETRFRLPLHHY